MVLITYLAIFIVSFISVQSRESRRNGFSQSSLNVRSVHKAFCVKLIRVKR